MKSVHLKMELSIMKLNYYPEKARTKYSFEFREAMLDKLYILIPGRDDFADELVLGNGSYEIRWLVFVSQLLNQSTLIKIVQLNRLLSKLLKYVAVCKIKCITIIYDSFQLFGTGTGTGKLKYKLKL